LGRAFSRLGERRLRVGAGKSLRLSPASSLLSCPCLARSQLILTRSTPRAGRRLTT